jgi:hypothetical protein
VKVVALVVAIACPLAAAAPLDSGRDWGHFRNPAAGHELRVPPGWLAYEVYGVTIVSARPLANPEASPADVKLHRGDVYLRIDQTATKVYAGDEPARPERFAKLPPAQGYDCGFGHGHALLFRERGYHVHAFVRLEGGGDRTALAILNTLRVTK